MSETVNRGYPIPDPALAIHPGVRDLAVAIDADVAALISSIAIDPTTMEVVADPTSMEVVISG